MGEIEFPYAKEESGVFGSVMRPRIIMDLFSIPRAEWLPIDDVLVDTGADLSVLPRFIGELLVKDTTDGKYSEIKGVIPGTTLVAYVHQILARVGSLEFEAPVAIADSNDVPVIFGRVDGLDRFDANFLNGETVKLCWR
jgi:hypothetical protein